MNPTVQQRTHNVADQITQMAIKENPDISTWSNAVCQFDDNGNIVFSKALDPLELKAMGIDISKSYQIEIKDLSQVEYIQYHRRKFIKQD